MEKLTQQQIQNSLEKISDLLNYINDEDLIFEFDSSLIDRLIRCYEALKLKTGEAPNKQTERLERYATWYSGSILNDIKS